MNDVVSSVLAIGFWPAIPLIGRRLLLRDTHAAKGSSPPWITLFALDTAAGAVCASAVLFGCALFGLYRPAAIGAIGWTVTLAALMRRLLSRSVVRIRPQLSHALLATGLSVAAALYLGFPTETSGSGRDQSVYANYAVFLAHHGTLEIPYPWVPQGDVDAASVLAAAPAPIRWNTKELPSTETTFFYPGFFRTSPALTAQFSAVFPLWLAQAFASSGVVGLFRLNALFALLSVATFYGLCHAVVPSSFAVAAALLLALNPSEIWAARITLAEMMAQWLVVSQMLLLLYASRFGDRLAARGAGILLAFSIWVKIDLVSLVPLLLASQIVAESFLPPVSRERFPWRDFWTTATGGMVLVLAYFAVYSTPYLLALSNELVPVALVTLGLLLSSSFFRATASRLTSQEARSAVVIVGLSCVAAWIAYAAAMKMHWGDVAQYLSIPVAVLGVFGWLSTAFWGTRNDRDAELFVPCLVGLGTAAVYLWNPNVESDHFWAIRRQVPVVIPSLILFATISCSKAALWLPERVAVALTTAFALYLAWFSIRADRLIAFFAENRGAFAALRTCADRLPPQAVVLAYGLEGWLSPLYLVFDRPVAPIDLYDRTGRDQFERWVQRQSNRGEPIYVIHEGRAQLPGAEVAGQCALEWSLFEPVRHRIPSNITVYRRSLRLLMRHGPLRPADYLSVRLGAEPVIGVTESGFSWQEGSSEAPFRWTNGAARLGIPIAREHPPKRMSIHLSSTGPLGTFLRLRANQRKLFSGRLPPGEWTHLFALKPEDLGDEVEIEIDSNTFVPRSSLRHSRDERRLGVQVADVRLLSED